MNYRTKKETKELRKMLKDYSIKELKSIIIRISPIKNAPFRYILERDNNKCRLCGREEEVQVHHITPRTLGGDNHEYNLLTLCKFCHSFIHCNPMSRVHKSDLVKSAMVKINGNTFSVKGKRWGRKSLINNKKLKGEILKLRNEGKTIREISETVYYWSSGHKKYVSVGFVHKLLKKSGVKVKENEISKFSKIKCEESTN